MIYLTIQFSHALMFILDFFFIFQIFLVHGFSVEIISPQAHRELPSATALPITGPAMELAMETLKEDYPALDVRLTYLMNTNIKTCDDYVADNDFALSDYYYRRKMATNLTVFIFPGSCTRETVPAAKLIAGWNELLIIGAYTNVAFRNRDFFPAVIQAGPVVASQLNYAIYSFVRRFGWKIIYVVSDKSGPGFTLFIQGAIAFAATLRATAADYTVYLETIDSEMGKLTASVDKVLTDVKKVARVISFWGHATSLRRFMIQAYRQNMTSAEYVYFFLEGYETPNFFFGNCTWQNHDQEDAVALAAFGSLFTVSPTSIATAEEEANKNNLVKRMIRKAWLAYNYTYLGGFGPTPSELASYSSVVILGQILNKLLTNQSLLTANIFQAPELASQIAGHTFTTNAGEIEFDSHGERVVQFVAKQLNFTTGILQPVLRQQKNARGKFVEIHPIRWQNGGPPPDKPVCGFLGFSGPCSNEKAEREKYHRTVLIGSLVAVGLLGSLIVFHQIFSLVTNNSDLRQAFLRYKLSDDLITRPKSRMAIMHRSKISYLARCVF